MLENMASFVSSEHLGAATFDPPVGPTGDGRLLSPNYRPVPTKDGYVTVRPNTNAQAFAFFDAIGRPELKTDPRFDSAASRTRNAAAYFEVQATSLGHKTTDEWVELFDKLDVPAARYNSIDDLMTDPHLKDVGFFKEEEHPTRGQDPAQQARQRLLRRRPRGRDATPRCIGEHTREILAELGYGKADIDKMIAGKAVRSGEAMLAERRQPLYVQARDADGKSERPVALDQHALHDAPLAHRIVDVDAMHGGAVVPDHAVADRPFMGEMVLRLARFGRQLVEQLIALGPLQPDDAVEPVEVEVERLAARCRDACAPADARHRASRRSPAPCAATAGCVPARCRRHGWRACRRYACLVNSGSAS